MKVKSLLLLTWPKKSSNQSAMLPTQARLAMARSSSLQLKKLFESEPVKPALKRCNRPN